MICVEVSSWLTLAMTLLVLFSFYYFHFALFYSFLISLVDVYRYVEADYNERQAIIEKVKYIIQGQLYYLANDPLVPSTTRNSFSSYGYCNDQWVFFYY